MYKSKSKRPVFKSTRKIFIILYTIRTFEPRISIVELICSPDYADNGFSVEMTYVITGSDEPPTNVEFFLARTR